MAEGSGGAPAGAVAEARAYLRIDGDGEDALLALVAGAAIGLCERFTGLALVTAEREAVVAADGSWRRLPLAPVAAITDVAALAADGGATALPVGGYAIDVDAGGGGWVRGVGPGRLRVRYVAGLADGWEEVPAALRQGVARLAAHLHAHRDEAADAGPPAAVAALWRPWRRVRLA